MQKVEGSSPFTRSISLRGDEAEGRGNALCRLPLVMWGPLHRGGVAKW